MTQLPSKEEWLAVQDLFSEMLESADPSAFIEQQTEPHIREALRTLWRRHQEAEAKGFLDEQITLVMELGAANSALSFQPGQILTDRFAVLRVLGSGGMGEVYLADDRRLSETVAIKTIKPELGKSAENRARFLNEVRRARQVTHPNVCRIFDVFDHGGVSFYAMEYLAGATLAEVLATGKMQPERAKLIAAQVAEGLWAAHKNGVLHCDFKPANIILTGSGRSERSVITDFGLALALSRAGIASESKAIAGTPFYMAPEVLEGAAPSIRSDVYAFGRVLSQLLPDHRLVGRCTALQPDHRPASMEWVLKELKGSPTRRTLLISGAAVAATGLGALYLRDRLQPKIALGSRQRVRVNGFAPNGEESSKAVRALLMMALRQSPLLNVVGDRSYRSADGIAISSAGFSLPLADLLSSAREEKANLVIDGQLQDDAQELKLRIKAYVLERDGVAYDTEVSVKDKRQLVHLAELAAARLRTEAFGESAFHGTYRPLEQITSSSTAAVDLYFRAVYQYEQADARSALTLLEQAIAIDPNFVLAYHYKALALAATNLMESAQVSAQAAFNRRSLVTERERNWVESLYFNIVGAWAESVDALSRNIVLFPNEAIFERQAAFALARLGRYSEAILHNRRSVELDPFGENNTTELLLNLAEANRIPEFLTVKEQWDASGREPDYFSLGLADLQRARYTEALGDFQALGVGNSRRQSWSRLNVAVPLILQGRFVDAIASLEGDLAWDAAKIELDRDETRNYMRRAWLGELHRLRDETQLSLQQADALVHVKPMACNLTALREGTLLALQLKETGLARRGVDQLASVATQSPSQHSQGALWLAQALLAELQGEPGSAQLFAKAKAVWPDPLNLYFIAASEGKAGRLDAQLATLKNLEGLRGKLYRLHFAGWTVLGLIEQARCLEKLSRPSEALRLYDRVAEHWDDPQTAGLLMRQVSQERSELKRRLS